MYTLAFISDDINFIVSETFKTIPQVSQYYQTIAHVLRRHKKNHDDKPVQPLY